MGPLIFILTCLLPFKAFAWSEHHLISHSALINHPNAQKKVKVTLLEDLLKETSHKNLAGLIKFLKIKKNYTFDFRMQEKPGTEIELIKIVSHYSDEPDWGMDTELFTPEQYPELWKSEYSMMGGTKGTPSQSFRHMYWPAFSTKSPLATFKLPINQITKVMGEANVRAKLFFSLAKEAKAKGHPYWAARFLGNAFHFVEDVTNPFHSTQTPTKIFMFMPFLKSKYGDGLKRYVFQVQNIITYYHFAFEDYVASTMRKNKQPEFQQNLSNNCSEESPPPSHIDEGVVYLATLASTEAAAAAKSCLDFFPELNMKYVQFDAKLFMNEEWWKKTELTGMSESDAKKKYFSVVKKMFCPLGQSLRFYFSSLF